MNKNELISELKSLLALVADKTTTLADSVMEIDVNEYTNPSQFALEQSTLFRDYAQFVGPSCLIPNNGDYFAFDDTGIPILIVRGDDGKLKAFINICSHRGAPLNEACFGHAKKGRMFSCPYHGWSYNLDGELIGVPFGKQGFDTIDKATLGLKPLQVEEKYGMILVMPNPDKCFDIDEVLSGINERSKGFGFDNHYHLGQKQVFTDFSWKLNMDTFHEYYHFEFLHPESIATMAYSNIATYHQFGRNHSMGSPSLQINELKDIQEDQWEARKYSSFVNYIFPNTVIFIVEDHFQTWRVYPISPEKSVVYHNMYIPEEPKSEEEKTQFEEYFQMINDVAVSEDYALVDKVHKGLKAGIERKVIIGKNEPGVQNMHREIKRLLS